MNDLFLLFINASILWGVVAGLLTWLLRFKTLVLVLFLAPLVIGSTLRNIAGMPELIGFYGTSLLYGSPGIIAGMLYADYQRTKAYFAKVSKTSFLARGGIGLSSVYLLGYFSQKIIFDNPMVEFALGYIKGGDRAKQIASQVDYDGALTAGGVIVACVGVIAFNTYREQRGAGQANLQPALQDQKTDIPS
ncbi:hypothetical protein [Sulfitobacter geojensis]|uniref:Uncharacterized protein n=1 Tax=Sulfitobacter geojensis TaxID=1342299 RepID=A0AAE2W3A7_9RHOB|nr:hypothetical protein [Sulfitobacter geojensis]MBM1691589.1 hypothetical protein [Sulfitobacter geojensis]MBM1695644.1 hypothetical protein [Sulfitobacter geojensis]MBM1707816.1 hypothetical protein [Sulfitobacter geojensis]MBM1711885.1 hypothetical protein [Sulfitobacter geojensis]MBM1715952.1 hypothetical protein [Sulfitobacter geojensis]